MRAKPYPIEKRRLIAARPVKEISDFIQSIPQNSILRFLSTLPAVRGFRPGAREQQQKLKEYVVRLRTHVEGRAADREWSAFRDLFIDWVEGHAALNQVLSEFDNSADFPEGEPPKPPSTALDLDCFAHLAKASQEGHVSRETIQDLYRFGYFCKDQAIEQYIALAWSQAQIRLLSVPDQIKGIQDELTRLKTGLASVVRALQAAEERIAKLKESDLSVQRMEQRFQTEEEKANQNKGITKGLDDLRSQITELQATVKVTSAKTAEQERCHTELQRDLASLVGRLGSLETAASRTPHIGTSRRERWDEGDSEYGNPTTVVFDLQTHSEIGERLSDIENVLRALRKNLQAIGIASASARPLHFEVALALFLGQVAIFRGSMATLVAHLCAQSWASSHYAIMKVPVGLLDGRGFRLFLERELDEARLENTLSAVIIQGINRSSIEAYGDALRWFVTQNHFGLNRSDPPLIVIATLTDGPASLPLSPQICDLGPVFDTDCLTWADRANPKDVVLGYIPKGIWRAITVQESPTPKDWSLIEEDFESILQGNVLSRRCQESAFRGLTALSGKNAEVRPLESLAFGWLVPRAQAVGAPISSQTSPWKALAGPDGNDSRLRRLIALVESRGDMP